MAFFGLFGNKQPAQPVSGGIETGIPAGVPPTAQPASPDINTLGGLMPNVSAVEQPAATGDLNETGTWAAAKSALDAERTAATATPTPEVSTPPMGTFGATPTPEAIASLKTEEVTPPPAAPETPLVSSPIKTPAEQFATPVTEVTEIKSPDTGPSDEPTAETQAPVLPISEIITPPPAFSMDALTAPASEPPALNTASLPVEPMTHEVATAPEETPAPVSDVTSTAEISETLTAAPEPARDVVETTQEPTREDSVMLKPASEIIEATPEAEVTMPEPAQTEQPTVPEPAQATVEETPETAVGTAQPETAPAPEKPSEETPEAPLNVSTFPSSNDATATASSYEPIVPAEPAPTELPQAA